MKLATLIIAISFCFNALVSAQTNTNRAEELMKQAQSNLEQKEYIKARYLFMQAYGAFATQKNYSQAIECGLKVSSLYHRENYFKEAFDICRSMYMLIAEGEQVQQKKLYSLYFPVTKERLQIYTKLKNPAQAKLQIDQLEELARQAGSTTLNEELLYTQANYYYTFGLNNQGDAAFRQLIAQYKEKKEYNKVSECYKNLITIARGANNAALVGRTYEQFIVWTDSVRSLTAQDELNVLKRQYEEGQQIIQEKEDSLSTKQYIITGLCTLVVILLVGLAFLVVLLLRFLSTIRKQKQSIQIANEHNELKSHFISSISSQMEPSLSTLTTSAKQLPGAQTMIAQIEALRSFSNNIQTLSSLENSLTECYEINNINNISSFCEELIDKIKPNIPQNVATTVNAPKLQVKANSEQLEHILMHLLHNAAKYTEEGKIILDFKKRGAHTHQFIVTDTGAGIPSEQQENLFKPFTEVKDLTLGDGLGLPICALIATKMNGSLTLDKSYTKGSRFILELHS